MGCVQPVSSLAHSVWACFFADATLAAVCGIAVLVAELATLLKGGTRQDVRFVSARFEVLFSQMLDTGAGYSHAAYFFFSPEPDLAGLEVDLMIRGSSALRLAWGMKRPNKSFVASHDVRTRRYGADHS